jgi:hypothetical protein
MVNQTEGLCATCGWSAPYLVRRQPSTGTKISYAEKYRGTEFDSGATAVQMAEDDDVARGRLFVSVALAAMTGLLLLILAAPPGP